MFPGGVDAAFRLAAAAFTDPAPFVSRWRALTGGKTVLCPPWFPLPELLDAASLHPVLYPGDVPEGKKTPGRIVSGGLSIYYYLINTTSYLYEYDLILEVSSREFLTPRNVPDHLDFVEAMAEWAGETSGEPVSDGSLDRAIEQRNEVAALYREFDARCTALPGLYSASERLSLTGSGCVLPPALVAALIRTALDRPADRAMRTHKGRIFLAGNRANAAVAALLDRSASLVAGEDLRAWRATRGPGASGEGDPRLALARILPSRMESAGSPGTREEVRRFLDRVAATQADRVLWLLDLPEEGRPDVADAAGGLGIPLLAIGIRQIEDEDIETVRSVAAFLDGRSPPHPQPIR